MFDPAYIETALTKSLLQLYIAIINAHSACWLVVVMSFTGFCMCPTQVRTSYGQLFSNARRCTPIFSRLKAQLNTMQDATVTAITAHFCRSLLHIFVHVPARLVPNMASYFSKSFYYTFTFLYTIQNINGQQSLLLITRKNRCKFFFCALVHIPARFVPNMATYFIKL